MFRNLSDIGFSKFFARKPEAGKPEARTKGDIGRPLNNDQLKAACTVFGNDISTACRRISLGAAIKAIKQELEPAQIEFSEQLEKLLADMKQSLDALLERVTKLESEADVDLKRFDYGTPWGMTRKQASKPNGIHKPSPHTHKSAIDLNNISRDSFFDKQ